MWQLMTARLALRRLKGKDAKFSVTLATELQASIYPLTPSLPHSKLSENTVQPCVKNL